MKGRKVIFVGFADGCNGYRVFDPESRRYSTTENVYFYESFKHRVDSLRHFDRRRKVMKAGKNQPIQLDDWDDENAQAVRNLYADPDEWSEMKDQSEVKDEIREPQKAVNEVMAHETLRVSEQLRPNEVTAHEALRLSEQLRPLRHLPVGKEAVWTKADADFLKHARKENLQIILCGKSQVEGFSIAIEVSPIFAC